MKKTPSVRQVERWLLESRGDATLSAGEQEYIQRHVRRYAPTLQQLPRPGGGKLLDVGCFPGHLALAATRLGWEVTGLGTPAKLAGSPDFEDRMQRQGIRVVHANIERDEFPLSDETFDAVFFNETVEHLVFNPFHALDQIWRVMKPGAALIFSVPNLAGFDHRWALLRGRTIYPLLTGPLSAAFHADLAQRHIREYTPGECRYLLREQDKYLYQFDIRRIAMDRSWDGLFYAEDGYQVSVRRIRPGTVLRDLLCRVVPALRSNIIVVAEKPAAYHRIPGRALKVGGFFEPENSGACDACVRRPIEARWMMARAKIGIDLSSLPGPPHSIHALVWLPAPADVPAREVRTFFRGRIVGSFCVPPSAEPRRRVLAQGLEHVVPRTAPVLDLELTATPWKPADYGLADSRELGVLIGFEHLALRG